MSARKAGVRSLLISRHGLVRLHALSTALAWKRLQQMRMMYLLLGDPRGIGFRLPRKCSATLHRHLAPTLSPGVEERKSQ